MNIDERKEMNLCLPNRVTGNTREVVVNKLFALFSQGKVRSSKNNLTNFYNEFIENRKKDEDIASQTARKNECDWNTFFKDKPLVLVDISTITLSDLMNHFKNMTEGRKITRHAFGNAKGLLNQLFDLAYERNLVERNICRDLCTKRLKFKPEASKHDLVYSKEERDQIVDELKNSDNVYDKAIVIQFCLGCRVSEVKGFYWSDLDFDRKEINIHRELVDDENGNPILKNHTKNGMGEGNRVLPMTTRAEKIFSSIPKPEDKESLVFLRDYRPIRTQTVNDILRNVCRKLNIRYLSSHKIRAWGITEALASGMDQASVVFSSIKKSRKPY